MYRSGYQDPVLTKRAAELKALERQRMRQQQPGESFVAYQERLARQSGSIDAQSELSLTPAERHELSIIRSQISSGQAGVSIPAKYMAFVQDILPNGPQYDPIAAQKLRDSFLHATPKNGELQAQGAALRDTVAPQPVSPTMKKLLQRIAPDGVNAASVKMSLGQFNLALDQLDVCEEEKRLCRFEAWQMNLLHDYGRPAPATRKVEAAAKTKRPTLLGNSIKASTLDWR